MKKLLALMMILLLGNSCSDVSVIDRSIPDLYVQSFEQLPEVNGIDIVWLIDKSGSMTDDATKILQGITSMAESLPLEAGWRLSITSCDPSTTLQDDFFPILPGDTTGDIITMYNSVYPGQQEQGFDTLYNYIELMPGRYSEEDWMREDAALLVVFVSDEPEQSTQHPGSEFVNWIRDLRPLVSVNSIVIKDAALCPSYNGYGSGTGYIEATEDLGGEVIDFCTGDWSVALENVTQDIQPIESVILDYVPLVETIQVQIDGTENGDWFYVEESNTVVFTTVPSSGSWVTVSYLISE